MRYFFCKVSKYFNQNQLKNKKRKRGNISTPYPALLVTTADGEIAQNMVDIKAMFLFLNISLDTRYIGITISVPYKATENLAEKGLK